MHARTRLLFPFLAVGAASAVAALALLRLIIPAVAEWSSLMPDGIIDRWIDPTASAALSALVGLAGAAVGLRAIAADRAGRRAPVAVRSAAALTAVGVLLLTPGNAIPAAGYTFMVLAVAGIVVAAVLLTIRHPLAGGPLVLLLVAVGAVAILRLDGAELIAGIGGAILGRLPLMAVTGAYLVVIAALLLWAVGDAGPPYGRLAQGVLRHRRAITLVAAACALPYALARATWLTPWPLFGGSAEMFAADPAMLLTGLLLGTAMLTGGLLTLGLIRPWGERFPRRLAAIGGRAVPVGLAVIPAMLVAVLFTTASGELLLVAAENGFPVQGPVAIIEFAVVFPFWLWGPLLALAAWGYAMHRAAAPSAGAQPVGAGVAGSART